MLLGALAGVAAPKAIALVGLFFGSPTVGVGEPVIEDGYRLTAHRMECPATDLAHLVSEPRGQVCAVYLTVENLDDDARFFGGDIVAFVGRETFPRAEAYGKAFETILFRYTVAHGVVLFDVREDAHLTKVTFDSNRDDREVTVVREPGRDPPRAFFAWAQKGWERPRCQPLQSSHR